MQNTRPPRRFFQLHLSTALVLMLLAAGVLAANVLPRAHQFGNLKYEVSGWPWVLYVEVDYDDPGYYTLVTLQRGWATERSVKDYWYARMSGNIAVALGILTIAALVLEWRLRRREQESK